MKNEAKITRAFYIIIIPIVVLLVILNSGMLQRWFTAATVCGEDYNAVRYNYYYFSVYQEFVESDEYAASNYNMNVSAGSQQYDEDTTYKERFSQQAEERLILTACYDQMAQEAGYVFSEEELAPVEEKLAEIAAFCSEIGIKESSYFSAYYGAGMTREAFSEELTKETRAQAYRAYLSEAWELSQEELDSWLGSSPAEDVPLADLWLIQLDAVPARADGLVGERQLSDLEARLGRLAQRLAGGDSMEVLAAAYADQVWGDGGLVEGAGRADLPDVVAQWCFDGNQSAGASAVLMDGENGCGYLVLVAARDGSTAQKTARLQLTALAMDEMEAGMLAETAVEYHKFGMQLTTS